MPALTNVYRLHALKIHLREWKINKYLKRDEALFMWKVALNRKELEGKATTFRLHGELVRMSKVKRAVKDADEVTSICSELL